MISVWCNDTDYSIHGQVRFNRKKALSFDLGENGDYLLCKVCFMLIRFVIALGVIWWTYTEYHEYHPFF